MNIKKEEKYAEIAESSFWRLTKQALQEEIDRLCSLDNINSTEELCGAKMAKKIFNEFIRKIEGARDVLEFRE